jgi:predicted ATPase
MLSDYADPFNAPELIIMREILRSWRFYDTFRVDHDAPARRPSIVKFTPVMSSDGSDLAAASKRFARSATMRDLIERLTTLSRLAD